VSFSFASSCEYTTLLYGIGTCLTLASVILTECRLKCNRSHPCENCIRRGDASSCSYAAPGTRKKNQSQGATSPDDMQNRIDRLEGLVLSLMTNGAQSAGPAAAAAAISRSQSDSIASSSFPLELDREDDDMIKEEDEGDDSEVDGVTSSLGVLKVDPEKGKSLYFGDSHWHMVLADVSSIAPFRSDVCNCSWWKVFYLDFVQISFCRRILLWNDKVSPKNSATRNLKTCNYADFQSGSAAEEIELLNFHFMSHVQTILVEKMKSLIVPRSRKSRIIFRITRRNWKRTTRKSSSRNPALLEMGRHFFSVRIQQLQTSNFVLSCPPNRQLINWLLDI
jgi:hypothetical protein